MNSAVRSNAVINSLFPAHVKERLMDDCVPDSTSKSKNRSPVVEGGKRSNDSRAVTRILQAAAQSRLGHSGAGSSDNQDETPTNAISAGSKFKAYDSKPIADLFPRCSVLFGK